MTASNAASEDPKEESKSAMELCDEAVSALRVYQTPLTNADNALVMQGYNKCLAFKTAFSEALLIYWRLLCCKDHEHAMQQVEGNKDPIYFCLKDRTADAEELLMGLIDGAVRSLCPANQIVQREAYRATEDDVTLQRARGEELKLECETIEDYLRLFARCGIQPNMWVKFVDAFVWTHRTHTPYAQEDDFDDLDRGTESAIARAIAQQVALPAVNEYRNLKLLADKPVFAHALKEAWSSLDADDRMSFGENFYRTLLSKHPNLLDYFAKTDMDSLAVHLTMSIDMIIKSVADLGSPASSYRHILEHLGEIHRKIGVPTYGYALVGANMVNCIMPVFQEHENLGREAKTPCTAKELRSAFVRLYSEVMSMVYYPMLRQEKFYAAAKDFYQHIKVELGWSDGQLDKRLSEIEQEITATGSYTQTSTELELGARLAWRNSAKCIGRISWNTLKVRDCRHIGEPSQMFAEVEKHLLEATAGTNIQSIMTVFQPKKPNEAEGTRFWNHQYVRYAAYKDEETGKILGDPANLEITEYLLKNSYWTPPESKTAFDVLPLVVKVPGREKPYIYQLPDKVIFEVPIEHPFGPEISALGYRWTTVPAISNFKMNLGGIVYQNIPFNGWFVSTEIVRNFMERYDAGPAVAEAMGLDMNSDPMWRQQASCELERAVMHSFQKNGFTIVDPMTVGQSFCTHVRREREQHGRECPGQWSWIGGLVGPTNPTWHLEMRDFLVNPQYEYASEGLLLHTALGEVHDESAVPSTQEDASMASTATSAVSMPKVLILYGSETGTAEAAARRLKRSLNLIKPVVMDLNEAKGLSIVKKRNISHVVCICSTFGEGNPPSNAEEFFSTQIESSENAKFAVLALGSTLYPDFCQAGVVLDKKLAESGFERMTTLAKADEASGADGAISDWLKMMKNIILPSNLEQELISMLGTKSSKPLVNVFKWVEGGVASDSKSKAGSLCLSNTEVLKNVEGQSKSIRKITFEVPSPYETGDHLAVQPLNSDVMVNRLLACFETELISYGKLLNGCFDGTVGYMSKQAFELECIEGDERCPADVFFKTPTTLFDVLKSKLDLGLNSKDVGNILELGQRFLNEMLEKLEATKRDEVLKHPKVAEFQTLASSVLEGSSDDKTDLIDDLVASYPTTVAFLEYFKDLFLEDFPKQCGLQDAGTLLKLPELLAVMPRLQPRYYSISSSDKVSPKEVAITVGILKTTTTKGVEIDGVCSHYLASLKGGIDRAQVTVHTSTFRLPEKKDSPLIMVGAGTGLSPMMGFLEDCARNRKVTGFVGECALNERREGGEIHLFFGCRTEDDFIYEDLIRGYEKNGMIDLHLALSRSPKMPKKYVQHLIADMGKATADLLLNKDTHYYVCGDARMADDCYEACVELLRMHAVMSRVGAVAHLKRMRLEGRWQTDVWGIVSHFEDAKKAIEKSKRMAAKVWLSHFRDDD